MDDILYKTVYLCAINMVELSENSILIEIENFATELTK